MDLSSVTTDEPIEFSTFLETYPEELQYQLPPSLRYPWVFWSQDSSTIDNKILSALKYEINDCKCLLLQVWVPVIIRGRRRLTTSGQPFVLDDLGSSILKHRLCSLKYMYDIDVNNLEVEKDPMIISGAPAVAFLNRMPEIVLNLTVCSGCPLMSAALECGLKASFVLPVFDDPSQSRCIGVFECYLDMSDADGIVFDRLGKALKKQGLYPFDVKAHLASMNICGLEDAKNEIDKALQVIIQVKVVDFVQVWIAYEDENHAAFLSSLDDTQKKRMVGFRLTSRYDDNAFETYEDYIMECDLSPFLTGKGLAETTVQNNEAHFCADYSIFEGDSEGSCFTICFKNNKTGDLLYVFEFFWGEHSHYIFMLELVLSSLKKVLPSFNLISGAQFDDELHVIDVDDSTQSGKGFFKIFEGNKSSSIPNAVSKGKKTNILVEGPPNKKCKTAEKKLPLEKIKEQFGKTMKEAATTLNVSLSTLKRKWNKYVAEGCVPFDEWPGPIYEKRKNDLEALGQGSTSAPEVDMKAVVRGSTFVGNDDSKARVSLPMSGVEELQSQVNTLTETIHLIKQERTNMEIKLTSQVNYLTKTVDTLKALYETSLFNSSTTGKKLISDNSFGRAEKEEAFKFSVNKGSVVGEMEKDEPVAQKEAADRHMQTFSAAEFPSFTDFINFHDRNCYLSVSGNLVADNNFWDRLLGVDGDGWLHSQHLNWWSLRIVFLRSPISRWTCMPSDFVSKVGVNPDFKGMVTGTTRPYPSWTEVDYVLLPINVHNHWMAAVLNLRYMSITIFNSMRSFVAEVEINKWLYEFYTRLHTFLIKVGYDSRLGIRTQIMTIFHYYYCIQQAHGTGDCGVFTCMFLTKIAMGESIPSATTNEDAKEIAKKYRMYMAQEFYALRVDRIQGQRVKAAPGPGDNVLEVE